MKQVISRLDQYTTTMKSYTRFFRVHTKTVRFRFILGFYQKR
jgi:hypothetical protein